MDRLAPSNPSRRAARTLVLGIVAIAASLSHQRPASAQSCTVPQLKDPNCPPGEQTIDTYMNCYRKLYDDNVIPAFVSIADCTHVKADKAINGVLESLSAQVLKHATDGLGDILDLVNKSDSPPNKCVLDMNALDDSLGEIIRKEREAPDLDAYRRANYVFGDLTSFTTLVLAARQDRAGCDRSLQLTRQGLQNLLDLKINHPNYCDILRQSGDYEKVSKIDKLENYTSLEPNIDYGQFFNISININPQCGYMDPNGGGGGATRGNQCTTGTIEYKQTLAHLDGTLGWIVSHREMISTVALAVGIAAFGPYGLLVGAAVELIISAIDFFTAEAAISDLEDMIAGKEQQLKAAIAAHVITEDQFSQRMTALCTPWQAVVEKRYLDALKPIEPVRHLQEISKYYALSDSFNDWYNELFRWATTPGPDGKRFLDQIAEQDLIDQRVAFDNRIFKSRADQEVASRKNTLTNIKGVITLMSCSGLTTTQKNAAKTKLRAGVRNFNRTCSTTMDSLTVQPDQAIPLAGDATTSDVVCAYNGFHNGVASLVISNGADFSSNMTLKDKNGAVLAQLTNITSNTDFSQIGFAGFACSSESGLAFGTAADTQLAAGSYAMHVQDNILGFDDASADSLRTSIQSLDSQLRLKVNTCTQQLGVPVNVPRPGDACGIPVSF
jgi:hypothetical protein